MPIQMMLLAGFGFEILAKLGLKTTVNRARVRKLFYSTNIIPKHLREAGFPFGYDLRSSLSDWRNASGRWISPKISTASSAFGAAFPAHISWCGVPGSQRRAAH